MNLVRYEAAKAALQAAHKVDEVKSIRDKAQAMAAYARQAKDTQLVEWATEIKVRAERRAGEMLADLELKPGPKINGDTLSLLGIEKHQSSRWQKLAAIPESKFEKAVEAAKQVAGEVTTAALLRIGRKPKPRPEQEEEIIEAPEQTENPDDFRATFLLRSELAYKAAEQCQDLIADKPPSLEKKDWRELIGAAKEVVKLWQSLISNMESA